MKKDVFADPFQPKRHVDYVLAERVSMLPGEYWLSLRTADGYAHSPMPRYKVMMSLQVKAAVAAPTLSVAQLGHSCVVLCESGQPKGTTLQVRHRP